MLCLYFIMLLCFIMCAWHEHVTTIKSCKRLHSLFNVKRCQVNSSCNVVVVCKVLKSLHVIVQAKLITSSGLLNTKL